MSSDGGGAITDPVVTEGSSESWGLPSLGNPFTVKVAQVFTGFGVGCGVGIGVGRPINIGALPALQQVLSATRGATDVFSGAGRHLNSSLKRLGLRNVEAGIGCGVGFGHGFGVGLAIKPSTIQRLQIFCAQAMAKVMAKLGVGYSFPAIPGTFPISVHGSKDASGGSIWSPLKMSPETARSNISGLGNNWATSQPSENTISSSSMGSRTEKVLSSFLQNPILAKEDGETELNELAGKLRSENNVLQVVLKHQKMIDELVEENKKLRKVLVEELNISPSKLQDSPHRSEFISPCSTCFECRRKSR